MDAFTYGLKRVRLRTRKRMQISRPPRDFGRDDKSVVRILTFFRWIILANFVTNLSSRPERSGAERSANSYGFSPFKKQARATANVCRHCGPG